MDCPESYYFTESYETQLRHLGSNGEKGLPHPFGEIKLTKGSVLCGLQELFGLPRKTGRTGVLLK